MTSAFITVIIIVGAALFNGNGMFSAGSLNAQAGAPLSGVTSHAEIGNDCARCHPAPWSADHLADRCIACHENTKVELADPSSLHGILRRNQTTLNCLLCHREHRGPNAPLTELSAATFPHELLGFSLKAHQSRADGSSFACKDCHAASSYRPFDENVCAKCHRQMDATFMQAHTIGFGTACTNCHDGVETLGKNFDHSKTTFALTGKHKQIICTACHTDVRNFADFKATSQDCFACHAKDDNHQGRFGTDCGSCHTPVGWKPAKFDHNLAAFKLIGKHTEVACEECHKNDVYKGTPMDCAACHLKDDAHNGQFGTDCGTCHTPVGWDQVNVDHSRFAFKLTGKHITVKCEGCHVNGVFKGTPTLCGTCHKKDDNHNERFGMNCGACHSTDAWKPATFDHKLSRFPLTGAHANLACERCHQNGVFQGLPLNCAGCHGDPGYHAGLFGSNCTECHNTSAWLPAQFNRAHNFDIFHEGSNGACRNCHPFTLATYDCSSCHPGGVPQEGGGGGGD
jgi:cytochrome c3-like protein